MANFTYDNTVPTPGNDPSDDVTAMQTNAASIASIWDVDHIGFGADDGGTHQQLTFANKVTPAAPAGDASVLYPEAGVEDTNPYLKFQNAIGTFPISCVRAFGSFTLIASTGAGQVVTAINGFNISSSTVTVTDLGLGSTLQYAFTINLVANAVSGTNAVAFTTLNVSTAVSTTSGGFPIATLTSNVITLEVIATSSGIINFVILQA